MTNQRTIFNLLIAAVFLIAANRAYGEWDPQFLISQSMIEGTRWNDLNHQKFRTLKVEVIKALENKWCTKEKAELIMDLILLERCQNCVEIGVFDGGSFLPIAATLNYLHQGKAYAIDPWSNWQATRYMAETDPNKEWWGTVDMDWVYKAYKRMLKEWKLESYCVTFKETSESAVGKVRDIDFLHFDGNYSKATSLFDAREYLPQVKIGGYILFSNLFLSVNGDQPKMDAFFYLLDSCEIVCEIDSGSTVLLKKISETTTADEDE
ncbi:MAG TPA: class I SAM-dependent methyltransferase [Chlamydiales bacterium]|jgi:hypothetical protein|nr:class I SAM-dependent methyltransferase [Chlamydiales bacterium]